MRRTRSGRLACLLIGVALPLSACGGDDPEPEPEPGPSEPTVAPPDVEVPAGVELSEEGSELAVGDRATAIYAANGSRVSIVDVAVTRVLEGSIMRDFKSFDLPDDIRRQTPYYVTVEVTNRGPGQLAGSPVPVFALDSTQTYFPATTLLGTLSACPGGPLPKPFGPKAAETRCLLFLVKRGEAVEEIQLRPYDGYDPVSWSVPEQVRTYQPEEPKKPEKPKEQGRPKNRG